VTAPTPFILPCYKGFRNRRTGPKKRKNQLELSALANIQFELKLGPELKLELDSGQG
jgi:hypothetical protein